MGSRILSRSFDVERTGTDEESLQELAVEADTSMESAMDVDIPDATTVTEDISEVKDDPSPEDDDGEERTEELVCAITDK